MNYIHFQMKKKIIVAKVQCDQCLFSENRIVSKERMEEIVDQCWKKKKYFICHKGSIANKNIACRGYFDYFMNKLFNNG